MDYIRQTITATGGTFTSEASTLGFEAFEMYTAGVVTMTASLSIGVSANLTFREFNIRWNANILLGAFTATICGITITQDQLNQTGTFTCVYDGLAWAVQYFADGKDQPQIAQGVKTVTVPVGGTLTLIAGVSEAYQRLKGPITLTSNYTVTAGTTGIKAGSQFQIELAGGIAIGSNTLTVFGISINANQALNGGVIIIATYDLLTNTWIAASTSKPISTADLNPSTALSVMGNNTNVSATPSDITFSTNYGVLQRSGTTLTTGLLTASNFDSTIIPTQVAIVSLTSTQIKNSNTAAIKILDSPGVGRANIISSILASCTFVSVAYTANLDVNVYAVGGTAKLFTRDNLLAFTSSGIDQLYPYEVSTSQFQNAANSEIRFATAVGNPLTGDGTITLRIIYQTINV
jgi:hypothetical protein